MPLGREAGALGLGWEEKKQYTDDVGADDLILGVAEGLVGGGLHRGVDAVDGHVLTLHDGNQDGGGTGRGPYELQKLLSLNQYGSISVFVQNFLLFLQNIFCE